MPTKPTKPKRKPAASVRGSRRQAARPTEVLTFAGWVRKWRLGPGMNDRHAEILEWIADCDHLGYEGTADDMRALHAEGLYSGFDGRVGPGWLPLLDQLVSRLVDLGWDRDLHQVKSKFHTLRFYVGDRTPKMDALIRAAERASGRICCECGRRVEVKLRKNGALPGWCPPCLAAAERRSRMTFRYPEARRKRPRP